MEINKNKFHFPYFTGGVSKYGYENPQIHCILESNGKFLGCGITTDILQILQ